MATTTRSAPWGRWRSVAAGLLGMGLVAVTGCFNNADSIETIFQRQTEALSKLPEEDETWRSRYEPDRQHNALSILSPGSTLDVETARRIALQDSPDVHAARARIDQALARILEARSAFFPVVGVGHSSTRTILIPRSRNAFNIPLSRSIPNIPADVQDFDFNTVLQVLTLPLFNTSRSSGIGRSFSQHSTNVTATWTLFEGFFRDATLLAAKYAHQAGKMALIDLQRLLVQSVDAAYYQAQLGRERIRIARENEKFSDKLLTDARNRFNAGKATQADVLNFEVRLKSAQADVVEAKGLMDNSRIVLAELMGIDAAQLPADITLALLQKESEDDLTPPNVEEWVERALTQRPDLARKALELRGKTEELRAAKGRFSPVVSLSGSYGFDRLSNVAYEDDDQSSAGAIDVRWELTTGGFRRARVRLRESERWQIAAELRRLRQTIGSEVRQAVNNLITAQERVRLQRVTLVSAKENRRIITAEYRAGKETLVRLNDAQLAFVETDASLSLSRIQLRQAWTDLRAAAATMRAGS